MNAPVASVFPAQWSVCAGATLTSEEVEHSGAVPTAWEQDPFFLRIPRAGDVEKARAKINMQSQPDPPLRFLSGNQTHFQLPSDGQSLPVGQRQMLSTRCAPSLKKEPVSPRRAGCRRGVPAVCVAGSCRIAPSVLAQSIR